MTDIIDCYPSPKNVQELAWALGIRCSIHEPPEEVLGLTTAVEFLWPIGDGFAHRNYPSLQSAYDALLKYAHEVEGTHHTRKIQSPPCEGTIPLKRIREIVAEVVRSRRAEAKEESHDA